VRLGEVLGLPLSPQRRPLRAGPEREILDVFTSIGTTANSKEAGRLLERNDERHLRSSEEMILLFRICRRPFTTLANFQQDSATRWLSWLWNFRAIPSRRRNDGFVSSKAHRRRVSKSLCGETRR